jgi:hypothetical protein
MRVLEAMQISHEYVCYQQELLEMAKRILTKNICDKRLEKVSLGIAVNCLVIMLILVIKELI